MLVVDYTPSAQDIAIGQIILTLTGKRDPLNCGAETSDSKIITFLKEPTAEAGDDQTICANDTAVLDRCYCNKRVTNRLDYFRNRSLFTK